MVIFFSHFLLQRLRGTKRTVKGEDCLILIHVLLLYIIYIIYIVYGGVKGREWKVYLTFLEEGTVLFSFSYNIYHIFSAFHTILIPSFRLFIPSIYLLSTFHFSGKKRKFLLRTMSVLAVCMSTTKNIL